MKVQSGTRKPSVVISDRHLLVAQGLALALSGAYDVQGIVRSGRELEELLRNNPPDIIITEVALLHKSGLDVMEAAQKAALPIAFVIFTSLADPVTLRRAIHAGASGIISKVEGLDALRSAIDLALQGKLYLSSSIMDLLVSEQRLPRIRITDRQQVILDLMAEGLGAQEIADRLGLSKRTVESHKSQLLNMTNTHSPQELIVHARRLGLLRPIELRQPPEE
ncbi:response regulator transcription factor [Dyella solisilvae]|nr:response regulator transcription factor [Dyella solisilvae]